MRNFMKKVAAALARLRSSVSEAVLVAVRGVDGMLTWTSEVVTRSIGEPTAPTHWEPEEPEAHVQEPAVVTPGELDRRMLAEAGAQAVRAAQAAVRGQPVPADVRPVVALWIANLSRDDQWTVAGAEPAVVGRHMAGGETLRSPEGFVLRRPEPEADRKRDVARRERLVEEAERKRSEQAEHAAAMRRQRSERVEWEAGLLSPAPAFNP